MFTIASTYLQSSQVPKKLDCASKQKFHSFITKWNVFTSSVCFLLTGIVFQFRQPIRVMICLNLLVFCFLLIECYTAVSNIFSRIFFPFLQISIIFLTGFKLIPTDWIFGTKDGLTKSEIKKKYKFDENKVEIDGANAKVIYGK